MNVFGKYCLLAVVFLSISSLVMAEEVKDKKEECPKGQVFDKEKGVCVDEVVVPVEHEKVEAPVSK